MPGQWGLPARISGTACVVGVEGVLEGVDGDALPRRQASARLVTMVADNEDPVVLAAQQA